MSEVTDASLYFLILDVQDYQKMVRQAIVVLLVLICSSSYGQYYYYDDKYLDNDYLFEVGVSAGIMNCVTDVGQKKGSPFWFSGYDWKSMKVAGALYGTFTYMNTWEARAELTFGGIVANDERSDSKWEQNRHLSFKSKILELALTGAFHPMAAFDIGFLPAYSPYIMAGVGVFSYYPKAYHDGEWVPLRRYRTEGQESSVYPAKKMYGVRALSFPIGLGVKYEVNAKYNVRLEGVYRFTSTDYLDDASTIYVSRAALDNDPDRFRLAHHYKDINPRADYTGKRRANAGDKDKFFTIMLKVGYVLGREKIRKK